MRRFWKNIGIPGGQRDSKENNTTGESSVPNSGAVESIAEESDSTETEKVNPLASKVYDALTISADDDFTAILDSLNDEYSSLILTYSDYVIEHSTDIEENGLSFSDFDDYETTLDGFYAFLYKVSNCPSDNVPADYQDAWKIYKSTVIANKADLDGLYFLTGQDFIRKSSAMLSAIQSGITATSDALPSSNLVDVKIGDTITLDFMEMTLEEVTFTEDILPPDTSGAYSYLEGAENEVFLCLTGTFKNLSGESYDIENIFVSAEFNDTYTYSGFLDASNWNNTLYDSYVKPLGTVKYYIYCSVPSELLDIWESCDLIFGFAENFSVTYPTKDECVYMYRLQIENTPST